MKESRGSLYLLTGFILGLGIGLLYAWVIHPVEYVNTAPATLKSEYKERYRALIASAYMANGDLLRAKARLELLDGKDPSGPLALQAQMALMEGDSPAEARALGLLSVALSQQSGSGQGSAASLLATQLALTPQNRLQATPTAASTATSQLTPTPSATSTPTAPSVPSQTPAAQATASTDRPATTPTGAQTISPTARPESSPNPSGTPFPTPAQSPTPGAPFALESREQSCEPGLAEPIIQVYALDAASNPEPGAEIILNWSGGEEHFFTGLKPEMGLGYADFSMTPGVVYSLRLADGGQPVNDLAAVECSGRTGQQTWGAWVLTFARP